MVALSSREHTGCAPFLYHYVQLGYGLPNIQGKRSLTRGMKECFVHVCVCVCIEVGVVVSLFLIVRKFLSETVFGSLASCQTPASYESRVTYCGEGHLYNHLRLVFFEMHPYMPLVRRLHLDFWPVYADLFFVKRKTRQSLIFYLNVWWSVVSMFFAVLQIITYRYPLFEVTIFFSSFFPFVQIKSWGMSLINWPSLLLGMARSLKKWQWRNKRTTQSSPSFLGENTSATTSASLLWSSSSVCS